MSLEITQEDFLTIEQVTKLKNHCRDRAASGERNGIRDWAILHLALDTGLRVSEICSLKIRDIILEQEHASLIVRDGKGHKKRGVNVGDPLREHLLGFIDWKKKAAQSIGPSASLFISSRGGHALTRTAIYRVFKTNARILGLPSRFSIHSCRHTYASLLYRASKYNIRLVQKQLGHRSIQTTQVYADVLSEDAVIAVNKLPQ